MSFLWGKKDEFEKDNNTVRGVYKLNPSLNYLYKRTQLNPPYDPYIYLNKSYGESINSYGGICFKTEKELNDYTEYRFWHSEYTETINSLGGIAFTTDKVYNDYIEYVFLHYPYIGYKQDVITSYGGIVFTYSWEQNEVG
jgi:hypothetical protein